MKDGGVVSVDKKIIDQLDEAVRLGYKLDVGNFFNRDNYKRIDDALKVQVCKLGLRAGLDAIVRAESPEIANGINEGMKLVYSELLRLARIRGTTEPDYNREVQALNKEIGILKQNVVKTSTKIPKKIGKIFNKWQPESVQLKELVVQEKAAAAQEQGRSSASEAERVKKWNDDLNNNFNRLFNACYTNPTPEDQIRIKNEILRSYNERREGLGEDKIAVLNEFVISCASKAGFPGVTTKLLNESYAQRQQAAEPQQQKLLSLLAPIPVSINNRVDMGNIMRAIGDEFEHQGKTKRIVELYREAEKLVDPNSKEMFKDRFSEIATYYERNKKILPQLEPKQAAQAAVAKASKHPPVAPDVIPPQPQPEEPAAKVLRAVQSEAEREVQTELKRLFAVYSAIEVNNPEQRQKRINAVIAITDEYCRIRRETNIDVDWLNQFVYNTAKNAGMGSVNWEPQGLQSTFDKSQRKRAEAEEVAAVAPPPSPPQLPPELEALIEVNANAQKEMNALMEEIENEIADGWEEGIVDYDKLERDYEKAKKLVIVSGGDQTPAKVEALVTRVKALAEHYGVQLNDEMESALLPPSPPPLEQAVAEAASPIPVPVASPQPPEAKPVAEEAPPPPPPLRATPYPKWENISLRNPDRASNRADKKAMQKIMRDIKKELEASQDQSIDEKRLSRVEKAYKEACALADSDGQTVIAKRVILLAQHYEVKGIDKLEAMVASPPAAELQQAVVAPAPVAPVAPVPPPQQPLPPPSPPQQQSQQQPQSAEARYGAIKEEITKEFAKPWRSRDTKGIVTPLYEEALKNGIDRTRLQADILVLAQDQKVSEATVREVVFHESKAQIAAAARFTELFGQFRPRQPGINIDIANNINKEYLRLRENGTVDAEWLNRMVSSKAAKLNLTGWTPEKLNALQKAAKDKKEYDGIIADIGNKGAPALWSSPDPEGVAKQYAKALRIVGERGKARLQNDVLLAAWRIDEDKIRETVFGETKEQREIATEFRELFAKGSLERVLNRCIELRAKGEIDPEWLNRLIYYHADKARVNRVNDDWAPDKLEARLKEREQKLAASAVPPPLAPAAPVAPQSPPSPVAPVPPPPAISLAPVAPAVPPIPTPVAPLQQPLPQVAPVAPVPPSQQQQPQMQIAPAALSGEQQAALDALKKSISEHDKIGRISTEVRKKYRACLELDIDVQSLNAVVSSEGLKVGAEQKYWSLNNINANTDFQTIVRQSQDPVRRDFKAKLLRGDYSGLADRYQSQSTNPGWNKAGYQSNVFVFVEEECGIKDQEDRIRKEVFGESELQAAFAKRIAQAFKSREIVGEKGPQHIMQIIKDENWDVKLRAKLEDDYPKWVSELILHNARRAGVDHHPQWSRGNIEKQVEQSQQQQQPQMQQPPLPVAPLVPPPLAPVVPPPPPSLSREEQYAVDKFTELFNRLDVVGGAKQSNDYIDEEYRWFRGGDLSSQWLSRLISHKASQVGLNPEDFTSEKLEARYDVKKALSNIRGEFEKLPGPDYDKIARLYGTVILIVGDEGKAQLQAEILDIAGQERENAVRTSVFQETPAQIEAATQFTALFNELRGGATVADTTENIEVLYLKLRREGGELTPEWLNSLVYYKAGQAGVDSAYWTPETLNDIFQAKEREAGQPQPQQPLQPQRQQQQFQEQQQRGQQYPQPQQQGPLYPQPQQRGQQYPQPQQRQQYQQPQQQGPLYPRPQQQGPLYPQPQQRGQQYPQPQQRGQQYPQPQQGPLYQQPQQQGPLYPQPQQQGQQYQQPQQGQQYQQQYQGQSQQQQYQPYPQPQQPPVPEQQQVEPPQSSDKKKAEPQSQPQPEPQESGKKKDKKEQPPAPKESRIGSMAKTGRNLTGAGLGLAVAWVACVFIPGAQIALPFLLAASGFCLGTGIATLVVAAVAKIVDVVVVEPVKAAAKWVSGEKEPAPEQEKQREKPQITTERTPSKIKEREAGDPKAAREEARAESKKLSGAAVQPDEQPGRNRQHTVTASKPSARTP